MKKLVAVFTLFGSLCLQTLAAGGSRSEQP